MNQPKTQPTKLSAGAEEAARKIWRKQYPNLPSVDAATVQLYANIIDREAGAQAFTELLDAAKGLMNCHTGACWQTQEVRSKAFRALNQAIVKSESGMGGE